jgi:hypothetical protein
MRFVPPEPPPVGFGGGARKIARRGAGRRRNVRPSRASSSVFGTTPGKQANAGPGFFFYSARQQGSTAMKTLFALAAGALLAGCGVETASTAATAASLKKQELEQGQQTMQQAQEKIGGAMSQMQRRTAEGAEK